MATEVKRPELIEIDMEEFLPWVGVPHGGVQMKVPFSDQDFQRWVTHTENFNPLHFDDAWASASRFGRIVAPQSFTGIRMIGETAYSLSKTEMGPYHASDEYFFYGLRMYAGDKMWIDRVMSSARATKTRYGPSVFVTVDHTLSTQRGLVGKKRATTMLHPAANAIALGNDKIAAAADASPEPEWSESQLAEIRDQKLAYIRSWRTHDKRLYGAVKVGDKLPRGVLGPHTGTSFLYGETCCAQDVWGLTYVPADQPPPLPGRSQWTGERPGVARPDPEIAKLMPRARGHGLMNEGRGGHIYDRAAIRRGMPRAFAIGSMESIWAVDHLSNWAGEWGFLRHATIRFNNPILSGDITYIDAEVTDSSTGPAGYGTVHVTYNFVNQDGVRQCSGVGDIELPIA